MALFDTLLAGDKTPSPQGQSALLNLPAEIRNQIYNYTYPRHFLHIKRKFSRHYSETLPFVAFWYDDEKRTIQKGLLHLHISRLTNRLIVALNLVMNGMCICIGRAPGWRHLENIC